MGSISVYNLGSKGVNVDKSPIHLEDGELIQAQNAVSDDNTAGEGGLVNRLGLTKHNTSAGAGSVLGGIGVPLGPDFAASIDTATIYFSLGHSNGSGQNVWYSGTVNGTFLSATITSAIADWRDESTKLQVNLANNIGRTITGTFLGGKLYYAANDYTSGTTSPTIRVFNGTTDSELCKVLPATTRGISKMFSDHGEMYIMTDDSGSSDVDWVGRVFRLEADPPGHLIIIGTALATGYYPASIATYNDLIFVGTGRSTNTNEARVYRINPLDETVWTLDETLPNDRYVVRALASFRGLLYSASASSGAGGTQGQIRQRSLAGVWSVVDSTAAAGGSYDDLIEWDGFIYTASENYQVTAGAESVVRRSSDGTTWATVKTTALANPYEQLKVMGKRLFAFGINRVSHTLDGTTWVDDSMPYDNEWGGAFGALRT